MKNSKQVVQHLLDHGGLINLTSLRVEVGDEDVQSEVEQLGLLWCLVTT